MRFDGRALAETILATLRTQSITLKQQGVTPTLAVIQVGDDPASMAYIRQKQKAVEKIGANLILSHSPRWSSGEAGQSSVVSYQQLQEIIQTFNNDSSVHGIIVQRPLPEGLRADGILPSKDVDGFLPNSPYPVPVASAVLKIIDSAISSSTIPHPSSLDNLLRTKQIVVIGRGETAGKPITDLLIKKGYTVTVVHSQTKNPNEIIGGADIVISCVGKPNVVRRDNIKKSAILLSVGISRDSGGKLHGDYEEDEIKDIASFYTPTPGGVGPVNVACLMVNLVQAASKLL